MKVAVKRRSEIPASGPCHKDTVVFMTAYNINKSTKKLPRLKRWVGFEQLLKKHHISSFASDNTVVTSKGKVKYTIAHDPIKQSTKCNFTVEDKNKCLDDFQDDLKGISWLLLLKHSAEKLFDKSLYEVSFCFNMKQFLVTINSQLLQVDPLVFFLNGTVFVSYELIHFDSGIPLKSTEIHNIKSNYNTLPVENLRYFEKNGTFASDNRNISQIILNNVYSFLNELTKFKYTVDSFSFLHNTLIITNSQHNILDYIQTVSGAILPDLSLKNLSSTQDYLYYSFDSLGVITPLKSRDVSEILFDVQLLEALKMYLLLHMIIDFEVTETLDKTMDKKMYVERLLYPASVPIITHNVIENVKSTYSYKKYSAAIDFKINYLKMIQDRRLNANSRLLNILLYILTFMGSVGTLQILEEKFNLSFSIGLTVAGVLFVGFGIYWLLNETRK
ncbi:MAG: hypothetical protein IJO56_01830 [Oscillospiraceae bacterium]|nr:hypothetical protein [Oscillospiraceae bacterium]